MDTEYYVLMRKMNKFTNEINKIIDDKDKVENEKIIYKKYNNIYEFIINKVKKMTKLLLHKCAYINDEYELKLNIYQQIINISQLIQHYEIIKCMYR